MTLPPFSFFYGSLAELNINFIGRIPKLDYRHWRDEETLPYSVDPSQRVQRYEIPLDELRLRNSTRALSDEVRERFGEEFEKVFRKLKPDEFEGKYPLSSFAEYPNRLAVIANETKVGFTGKFNFRLHGYAD